MLRIGPGLFLCCAFLVGGAVTHKTARPKAQAGPAVPAALRGLSLHDRVAQLIVVRGYGDYPPSQSAEYQRFLRWIQKDHVGGFIVAGRIRDGNVIPAQPFEMAAFVNHIQKLAATPLLVGSDFERGASMRVADTAKFPFMMAFGAAHDVHATRQLGVETAREARALGVNWVFAPDADVNNNPDNPIINTRSFGEDPQAVAANVASFIDGAHADPAHYVLVSPKHFPGHGDTSQDSHLMLARVDEPKQRLESVELVPFRAAVEHGADSIMTAHLAVPAFEPDNLPATLSHNVLTGLLRDEMNYRGLIITDAMEMQGITSLFPEGEAAVRAVEAGADVLLMPTDPEPCILAIQAAIRSGRLTQARINTSAARVLAAKQKLGLFRTRFVSQDALTDSLTSEEASHLAQDVAQRALTLVKDDKHLFPIASGAQACLVLLRDDMFSQHGEILVRELQHRKQQVTVYAVGANSPQSLLDAVASGAQNCQAVYIATFITATAYKGSVALDGPLSRLMNGLLTGNAPAALIAFGSPYVLRDYPNAPSAMATFSAVSSSEIAVARALAGETPVIGRLPVTIPGVAALGAGLDLAPRAASAANSLP